MDDIGLTNGKSQQGRFSSTAKSQSLQWSVYGRLPHLRAPPVTLANAARGGEPTEGSAAVQMFGSYKEIIQIYGDLKGDHSFQGRPLVFKVDNAPPQVILSYTWGLPLPIVTTWLNAYGINCQEKL